MQADGASAMRAPFLFRRTVPPPGVVGWHFSWKEPAFMPSNQPLHFNLVAAAHASMLEHGFQPDFPAGADA